MNGTGYVVAGAVLWGVAAVVSKVGVSIVGPWAATFVRSVVFAAIVIGYAASRGRVRLEGSRTIGYGTLAGVTMGLAVISIRFAYAVYEVSRVVPLVRLSVVVTVLLGITLLDETVTPRKVAGIGCAVVAFVLLSP